MPWTESTFVSCMTLTASLMQGLQQNFAALGAQDSGAPPVTFANSTLVASAGLVTDVGCAGIWQAGSGFAGTGVASLGALHVGSHHGLLPPGHISGLTLLQHSADTAKGLDILAGAARDAGDADDLRLYAPLPNKRLDAAWSFGGSAGAVDSGTVQNDTWYHVHLVKRSDVGSVDALFSTSPDSPVLPADFDRFRRVGSFLTDTSTSITDFLTFERGDGSLEALWGVPVRDLNTSTASNFLAGELVTLSVPTSISVLADHLAHVTHLSAGEDTHLLVTHPDQANTVPTGAAFTVRAVSPGDNSNTHDSGRGLFPTNGAAQVRYRVDSSANRVIYGITYGWLDPRR